MSHDKNTKTENSPKQGGYLSRLNTYAAGHPWELVSNSIKMFTAEYLNKVTGTL